ncbi:MAG: hypothetical protein AVDCRST_MAG59-2606, partial [uncultured Thermomicrobiales bacterium]
CAIRPRRRCWFGAAYWQPKSLPSPPPPAVSTTRDPHPGWRAKRRPRRAGPRPPRLLQRGHRQPRPRYADIVLAAAEIATGVRPDLHDGVVTCSIDAAGVPLLPSGTAHSIGRRRTQLSRTEAGAPAWPRSPTKP